MDSIGTEVGQKMRSAIKAKLMELGCYVDDELPDYVMVMVANKRTRSQMEEDLQLFLRANTKNFVDWLQHVLNKLKEVTISNPGVYACSSFRELKRKASIEIVECLIKKEKKEKKHKPEKKTKSVAETVTTSTVNKELKSITDEIPVTANKLVEKRNQIRTIVNLDNHKAESSKDTKTSSSSSKNIVDKNDFDIPTLSEVGRTSNDDLLNVQEKTNESTDKLDMEKTDSEDEDFINIRADAEELLANELNDASNPSTFAEEPPKSAPKIIKLNRSSLECAEPNKSCNSANVSKAFHSVKEQEPGDSPKKHVQQESKKTKISLSETLREEKEILGKIRGNSQREIVKPNNVVVKRESVHKRLGLPSSVISLNKKAEKVQESSVVNEQHHSKSVPSVVQVKPRRLASGPCQANKNLLLKAVAEAQKSVVQAATKSHKKKGALFTKKYRETHNFSPERKVIAKTQTESDSMPKVQNIKIEVKNDNSKTVATVLDEDSSEYILPNLENKAHESNVDDNEYIPSAIDLNYDDLDKYINDTELDEEKSTEENTPEPETETTNHQFIVTLDGVKSDLLKVKDDTSNSSAEPPNKVIKKCPSPIIFDKGNSKKIPKSICKVPEKLPKVHIPVVKVKERCKYWPSCWLGETCEFVHPKLPCKTFPMCKFGDQCLYIHPKCKFSSSCTRKECPYSHKTGKIPSKTVPRSLSYHGSPPVEICKYFPKCSNAHCQYFHPKLCRFGKFCLNKAECNYSHGKIPAKEKLTWHSSIR